LFNFRALKNFDWIIIVITLLLFAIGIAIIFSTTFGTSGDGKEALEQGIFGGIGLLAFLIVAFFDYRSFRGISSVLYLTTIALLAIVVFTGVTTMGATRWINIGGFQFQPSEFAKLFMPSFYRMISFSHFLVCRSNTPFHPPWIRGATGIIPPRF